MHRRRTALIGMLVLGLGCSDEAAAITPSEGAAADLSAMAAPVARVAGADDWLDLVAQRPSAVVERFGAVVVDLGSHMATKHLSLGTRAAWRVGEVVGGKAAGVVVGRSASLDVPLDGALAPAAHPDRGDTPGLAMALEVRPMASRQSMTVLLNEQPLANLVLGEGWSRRTFSLPADLVRPGENRVRLFFRNIDEDKGGVAAAVASLVVGPHGRITHPPADAASLDFLRMVASQAASDDALHVRGERGPGGLVLTDGTALAYYLVPPVRGRLSLDVAGQGAVSVWVSTDADHVTGRLPTRLVDQPLRASGQVIHADLSGWGGTAIRLQIGVRGAGARATFAAARVEAPRTVPVDNRARVPRDVVIVTIEGMRQDALRLGKRPPLPEIDRLLAQSLVFARAYAPSPAAVPSHAAWLTSVRPPRHLTVRGTFVADNHVLLPEALARGGYVRAQATANADVNRSRGLMQGIDSSSTLTEVVEAVRAPAVIKDAIRRLQGKPGRWYLHANVNDPQAPYEPPRERVRETAVPPGAPLPHLTHIWVGRVRLGKVEPAPEEVAYIRRLYRGELQVVDTAVRDLVDWLERERRLEDAVVVLMGVHGEEFYEHGGAGHARTLYEESLRVPLAIHAPALLAPGRVDVPVDLLDVAPTLLDLLGVPMPDGWQGRSLVPIIDDPQPPPQAVGAYLGDGSQAMWVGPHKLVLGPGHNEVYTDLGENPSEDPQLASPPGVGLRIVRTALAWELSAGAAWRRARWGTGANLTSTFARDLGM